MATNLLWCFSDEPLKSIIASTTANAAYPAKNALGGERRKHYITNSAVTTSQIDCDYGAGVTKSPDFCIIAKANLLVANDSADVSITLSADDNSSFSSPEDETDTFGASDLVGRDSEDFVFATTYAAAARYFRAQIDTTESFKHEYSKAYFGESFDFGRDPLYPVDLRFERTSSSNRIDAARLRLRYRGITDAKKTSFESLIGQYAASHPLFLWDQNDYCLNGMTLLHCSIVSQNWYKRQLDEWELDIELLEAV